MVVAVTSYNRYYFGILWFTDSFPQLIFPPVFFSYLVSDGSRVTSYISSIAMPSFLSPNPLLIVS